MSNQHQASPPEVIERLEAQVAELNRQLEETAAERDKTNLLYEISAALSVALDFDAIASTAVSFADRFEASAGEIYLVTETDQIYFKSTYASSDKLDDRQQALVHLILSEGLEAWVLGQQQSAVVADTQTDERWTTFDRVDPKGGVRSAICSPITVEREYLRGAITFVHPEPNYFNEQDVALLDALTAQVAVALENTTLFEDLQQSLRETNLVAAASQKLVAASTLDEAYAALTQSAIDIGAERCTLHVCDDLDVDDVPKHSEVVYVQDVSDMGQDEVGYHFTIADYPVLKKLVRTQKTLVITDIAQEKKLDQIDRQFLAANGIKSVTIIPLVTRNRVSGLLFIQHRVPHNFGERELSLYHTICNQSIVAIENAKHMQLTEMALTETQTLYRAGRVLAGTTNLEEILQESLYEFLYSLHLDQGGITLLSPDRQVGELLAYVQNGQAQKIDALRFPIDETQPYQQALLSGQPFQSYDVSNDPRLSGFKHFNKKEKIKSLLQAPMIIRGETVGWIGADSVKENREFSQREIDLARAMADQIAITIQNRRLLEQSERQAEQLKAVAQVGKSVAQLLELDEILSRTVDLIRDQFGFYHVSIFLVDKAEEWAVVHASTGEIGRIMVETPHKLSVGGQSIVGYATAHRQPRIALDVGEDAVHFDNPLLPDTRSEMALPMVFQGRLIGALDVQSVQANAFGDDDVDTLQIMADQLAAVIDNATLFEQTDKNLRRTRSLYRVGEAMATATNLRETFEVVLGEYLNLLNLKQGSLMLVDPTKGLNEAKARYINGEPVDPNLTLSIEDDLVFRHLSDNREPLVIEDAQTHPLIKNSQKTRGQTKVRSMLFIPLLARGELVGSIIADSIETKHRFSENDIKIGEAMADQLGIWLENRQLLEEAQHRSNLLQAAAEVSRAASSILKPDQLINDTVNLIRDRFDLYYVGLFLVEDDWAVLRAGTGEAGRLQIEADHRLRVGSGSMIGWSVANREARIALDVGKESVHFKKNEFLPDTHSEMALPLVSRDEVLGALTVQSVERGAFSDEDVVLLRTMADQLANAIANARLFENVAQSRQEAEDRLQETLALQQLSQRLSTTLKVDEILDIVLQSCMKVIGFDYVLFSLVDRPRNRIKAITGLGITADQTQKIECSLDSDDIMADVIRQGEVEVISGWDRRFNQAAYRDEDQTSWVRLFMPVTLRQERIGLIEAGFKEANRRISNSQLGLLQAFMDQTVIALDNAQRYEISRRAARREEIIREVTSKIRNAVSIDDIMKVTVTELGKVVGASQGGISLDVPQQAADEETRPTNGSGSDNNFNKPASGETHA